jgi:hypothetical protein
MNATFKRPYGNQTNGHMQGANRDNHRTANPHTTESKLRDIAQSLDIMVGELQLLAERSQEGPVLLPSTPSSNVERAKQAYRNRRRREQVFGDASLFGEPAWDIMLDLYVAAAQDKRIAVTSACIGSAVPATTALRWIKILEDRGLIEREVDEVDARRTFVRLSPRGCELMEEYLAG